MVSEAQKFEITNALAVLSREEPLSVDESDEWSDEDLRDFTAASRFAEGTHDLGDAAIPAPAVT